MVNWCPSIFALVLSLSFASGALSAEPHGLGVDEFSTERMALVEATREFFDTVEAEQADDKKSAVLGWTVNATHSYAADGDVAALTKMGPVKHLTGYQVTWYPTDMLLGTVDFMGTWDGNRNLVCGYVTWDLSEPDDPQIHSISANFISPEALNQTDNREVHRSLIASNCAHGSINTNYAFFGMDANG